MARCGSSRRRSSERAAMETDDIIADGKYVELTYRVTDRKSGHVLTCVEFPLGYIHGHNVNLTFRPPNRAPVRALANFDIDIGEGEARQRGVVVRLRSQPPDR